MNARAERARVLVGRDEPLAAVDAVLAAAAEGSGSGLIVEGIAGIGKTALLAQAVERAVSLGFRVRHSVGVPLEAELPYGVLSAVFAAERRRTSRTPLAEPLISALGMAHSPASAGSGPLSWLEVSGDAIEVLSTAGADQPQLVVVDDVQWADASSLAVLGHIARHARADSIAVLFGRRTHEPSSVRHQQALAGIASIELRPLTMEESVAAMRGMGCSPAAAHRWAPRCGGLPLAISEVSRHGSVAEHEAIAAVLPDAFRARIGAVPPQSREALLALALANDLTIVRSVGGDAIVAALEHAVDAGIVQMDRTGDAPHADFRHPLMRAALLADVPVTEERAMHRRLAVALIEAGDLDRAALHLAAGAVADDAAAADAVTQLAERAQSRGALAESAVAYRRAADLSPDPDVKSGLLRRSADAFFDHGDASAAFAAVDEAISVALDRGVAADARDLRARISVWVTSPSASVRQLLEIAEDMRAVDGRRAATALAAACGSGHLTSDLRLAMERGRDAERIATEAGDIVLAASASGFLAWNACLVGEWTEWEERLEPLEPIMRMLIASRSWAGIHLAQLFGTTWVCAERWDTAEPLIRELLHVTRSMGARLTDAATSLLLGSLCWRRGRWEEAAALVMPLLDIVDVPPLTRAWMQVQIAELTASRGMVDETRRLVAEGLPVAVQADVPLIVAIGEAVLGHLELSLGDVEAALSHLDRTAALTESMGFVDPCYFLWQGDHLDALVRAGRNAEAADRAATLAKLGREGGRRWATGVAARIEAQLASDPDERSDAFERSLDDLESLGMPFEVGRTLLARGSERDLVDARRLFLRLGAGVWADAAEPRRSGGWDGVERRASDRAARESRRVLDQLTPAERSVALGVASGLTNRQIAAELHLSAKTVDHYLQHAYRRIGVRNRAELAATIALAISAPSR